MKRKQVVKLLSIGMAGILAISSCNVAGSMVHAEEAAQEVVVEAGSNEETSKQEVVEGEEEDQDDSATKGTDKETEESTEVTTELATEEETSEEATEEGTVEEETTEIAGEQVALAANVEEVELHQFYGQELSFDNTNGWDDKGENHLGLQTDKALNSGATVSFDLYIPADNAEYDGLIKVQGIARLGSGWSWTQIPFLNLAKMTFHKKLK